MGSVFSGDGFQIKTQMISELMPYTCKTNLWVEVGQFFLPIMLLDMPEHCALLNYDQVSPEILVGEFMRKDGCEWLVLLETDEHHEGGVQVQGYKAVEKDIWSSNWIASRNLVAWTKQPIGGLLTMVPPPLHLNLDINPQRNLWGWVQSKGSCKILGGLEPWECHSSCDQVSWCICSSKSNLPCREQTVAAAQVNFGVKRQAAAPADQSLFRWLRIFFSMTRSGHLGRFPASHHYFMIAKQGPRSKLGHFQQTTPPTWHSQRPHRSKTIWWIHAPNAKEAPPVSPSWAGQIRWC